MVPSSAVPVPFCVFPVKGSASGLKLNGGFCGTAMPSSGVTGVTPVEILLSLITHLAIFFVKVDLGILSSLPVVSGVSVLSVTKKSS